MSIYYLLVLFGSGGLAILAMLGFVHGHGPSGHGHGHGHTGHGGGNALTHGGKLHLAKFHSAKLHSAKIQGGKLHGHDGSAANSVKTGILDVSRGLALSLLSPVDIFSFVIGAGLAGVAFGSFLRGPLLAFALIAGALLFNFGVTKQVLRVFLSFAAKPSEGLEGSVRQSAIAESNFNHEGQGLVRLTLDGQLCTMLGRLDPMDASDGTAVCKGDELVVIEVDARRNQCLVAKLGL